MASLKTMMHNTFLL